MEWTVDSLREAIVREFTQAGYTCEPRGEAHILFADQLFHLRIIRSWRGRPYIYIDGGRMLRPQSSTLLRRIIEYMIQSIPTKIAAAQQEAIRAKAEARMNMLLKFVSQAGADACYRHNAMFSMIQFSTDALAPTVAALAVLRSKSISETTMQLAVEMLRKHDVGFAPIVADSMEDAGSEDYELMTMLRNL